MSFQKFEKAAESFLNETIGSIRQKPIDQRREEIEKSSKKSLHFTSYFPFIGRGNVLREHLVTHKKADQAFRKALK